MPFRRPYSVACSRLANPSSFLTEKRSYTRDGIQGSKLPFWETLTMQVDQGKSAMVLICKISRLIVLQVLRGIQRVEDVD